MAPRTTFEHVDNTKQSKVFHAAGTRVEVIHDMPELQRMFSYAGEIAMTPAERSKQSVVTAKYGPERIIQVAARYVLKTESVTVHHYSETERGKEILESIESPYVSDLIFDADHPAFKVIPTPQSVPQPRVQL